MDEEIHMNDLDPDGFDLGLARTDMGCIRMPEEKPDTEEKDAEGKEKAHVSSQDK